MKQSHLNLCHNNNVRPGVTQCYIQHWKPIFCAINKSPNEHQLPFRRGPSVVRALQREELAVGSETLLDCRLRATRGLLTRVRLTAECQKNCQRTEGCRLSRPPKPERGDTSEEAAGSGEFVLCAGIGLR
jgi:hypothetical protein